MPVILGVPCFGDGVTHGNTERSLSVVIPTVGRREELSRSLRTLVEVAGSLVSEVIVVFDGARPWQGLDELLGRIPLVVLWNDEVRGAAICRNEAAARARASYLAFLDDDVMPTARWATAVSDAVERGDPCITGPILPLDDTVLSRARDQRYRRRYAQLRCGTAVQFFAGGNGLVRTDLFRRLGGFPDVPAGSDNGLLRRLREQSTNSCSFCWGMSVWHRNDRGARAAVRAAWHSGAVERRAEGTLAAPVLDLYELESSAVNAALWLVKASAWCLEGLRSRPR